MLTASPHRCGDRDSPESDVHSVAVGFAPKGLTEASHRLTASKLEGAILENSCNIALNDMMIPRELDIEDVSE